MNKTITAKFESLDMAELAAIGLKNNFENISTIKIKYKNKTELKQAENNDIHHVPNKRTNKKSSPYSTMIDGTFSIGEKYLLQNYAQKNLPEIETSTESRLIVDVDPISKNKIEAKLRCLGGYDIETF